MILGHFYNIYYKTVKTLHIFSMDTKEWCISLALGTLIKARTRLLLINSHNIAKYVFIVKIKLPLAVIKISK